MRRFQPAPKPEDEIDRLATLHALGILDSLADRVYDDIAAIASQICKVPMSLITLVDEERQWFKSACGIKDLTETSREISFCAHAILEDDMLVVEDSLLDDRFAENPGVTGGLKIRFYAGVPVGLPNGHRLGALCVIDQVARTFSEEQKECLRMLARQVNSHLAHRLAIEGLQQAEKALRKNTERLDIILRRGHLGIWEANFKTGEVFLDHAWEKMLGYEADELPRTFEALHENIYHEDLAKVFAARDAHFADPTQSFEIEFRCNRKHGGVIWARSFAQGVDLDENGVPTRIVGLNQDITDTKLAQADYDQIHGRFRSAVETMQEGILVQDSEGVFVLCNDSACRILGLPREQIIGGVPLDPTYRTVREDGEPVPYDEYPVMIALRTGKPVRKVTMGVFKPSGELAWIMINAEPIFEQGGLKPKSVVCTFADITESIEMRRQIDSQFTSMGDMNVELELQREELAEANSLLETLSNTDALTTLYNRGFFQKAMAEQFSKRGKLGNLFSLVLLDVDHFKSFNDTCGHLAGDEVLKTVATLITKAVRGQDVVCRYGGEEFAVILPGASPETSNEVAERIRKMIESHPWTKRPVTASFGQATHAGPGSKFKGIDAMIIAADTALYDSKHNGRNRVTHFDAIGDERVAS